ELQAVLDNPSPAWQVLVDDADFDIWVRMQGPPDSPYSGQEFLIHVKFPHQYPFAGVRVSFLSEITHPVIRKCTNQASTLCDCICLGLEDKWSPTAAWTLETVYQSLLDPLETFFALQLTKRSFNGHYDESVTALQRAKMNQTLHLLADKIASLGGSFEHVAHSNRDMVALFQTSIHHAVSLTLEASVALQGVPDARVGGIFSSTKDALPDAVTQVENVIDGNEALTESLQKVHTLSAVLCEILVKFSP
ncbi:hypothetical protein HDU98_005211, partial [Podochytrium sp. JEL0797]